MYNRLRRDGGDGMAETPRSKRTLIRKGDMLVLVSLLAAALLLLLVMRLTARPGAEAVVTVPGGEFTLSLAGDQVREVTGLDGIPVVLEVNGGRIRFQSSGCPDKICVNSGWLSRAGQSAACVPAGVALRLVGGTQGVDAVTA
jgi:hypothetical protein